MSFDICHFHLPLPTHPAFSHSPCQPANLATAKDRVFSSLTVSLQIQKNRRSPPSGSNPRDHSSLRIGRQIRPFQSSRIAVVIDGSRGRNVNEQEPSRFGGWAFLPVSTGVSTKLTGKNAHLTADIRTPYRGHRVDRLIVRLFPVKAPQVPNPPAGAYGR